MYQKQSPSDSFFGHSIDNLNKNVNKDPNNFAMNDCTDQNDDGYETGVSDMMSMKYKHHPSFVTLPPSSPFSSISSISSTTPTNFANTQQQQSPIYNLGNNANYHYHHQQYQQSQMLNMNENNSQSSQYHLPNDNMIYGAAAGAGAAHNDPYNFANHEFQQQMNSHFGDVNDGKMMMSMDHSDNSTKFSQPPKYCNENGTNGNPGDFFSTLLDDKSLSIGEKTNSSKLNDATKKRGRKRKVKDEDNGDSMVEKPKGRRKHDRFNGMSEEELSQRQLPDHITYNLDIVIIGINPGLFAAYKGHHYAGPGNHFWKCLYLSGLTPVQMTAEEDFKLLELGIGFTNIVQRPTKGSADLTRKEIKDGCKLLLEKLQKFRPKVAVFNGKLIYEVFSGKKDFYFGKQADIVEGTNTQIWVMPSSSARCAQLPRAADKVPFYAALKKFKDYSNGLVAEYNENDYVFSDPKYNQISSTSSAISSELLVSPEPIEGASGENQSSSNKKKRGRPKKKNGEFNDGINCTQTKELDGDSLDDKHNNSKKKRGRPKKANGEATTKSTKKSKNSSISSYDNCLMDRSSISPAMESSSSFSNPHQHQLPVPVQPPPTQQNGKCNQTSRNQSPSLNMCHQSNLEMKPMMIGDIHSPHQQIPQDSNITYQQQPRNTQSPMVKEENLNLNDLSSFTNPQIHDHKPQITLPSLATNANDMSHEFSKTNGVQQYHTAASNQHPHPHAHAFHAHLHQQQQQQQQSQHHLFQNSTPHLISNITSETTTVYQNQQSRVEQQQVEPTYPTTPSFVATNEKAFGSHFTEQNKDISLKSLSGLESLVDQIASTNPEQETTTTCLPSASSVTAAPTPSYAAPYGSQHYNIYPSHPSTHGQHFSSPFPIGSFPSPSYPSFTNYHQNLINQSHVAMPVNPVYPNSGYPHHSSLLPYGNYGSGGYTQGSNSYYNPMFDRINF